MKYRVTLVGRVICRLDVMMTLPDIPGTEKEVVMDTGSGPGKDIWFSYLQIRQEQKGLEIADDDWAKVREPESDDPAREIHKFREAIDLFMRFLAEGSRDNCLVVKDIVAIA